MTDMVYDVIDIDNEQDILNFTKVVHEESDCGVYNSLRCAQFIISDTLLIERMVVFMQEHVEISQSCG